jgi:Astacin (Peptidase family M12A)
MLSRIAYSTLVIAALAGCHDSVLDETEQVIETFDVGLSVQRVVLTPGNRAVVRIAVQREDESIPVTLVAYGSSDVLATVSEPVVGQKPVTLTLQAAPKSPAQDVIVKLQANYGGTVAIAEVQVNVQVPTAPIAGAEAYAPGVVGEPKTVVLGDGIEVEAEVINGVVVAHGDLVLGEVNTLEARGALRSATCNFGFHTDFSCSPWSSGVIGYSFADNWGSAAENTRMRTVIREAIAQWELHTGLRFALRNYGEYIEFRNGDGCSSTIGRAIITGFDSQSVSLHPTCGTMGVVAHEIGHAIGLWHEHSRNDRESFVDVNWGRIQDFKQANFWQWGDALLDRGPYDYTSIMHYGRSAFAKNPGACEGGDINECTLRTDDPTAATTIGQRDHLSDGDILGAYMLYPPSYQIRGAADGATNDRFWLTLLFEIESPNPRHMVWTSDRVAGTLGTGHSLDLRAADVPSGTHVITASMVINGTNVTSRSITINFANAAPVVALAATNGRTTQDLGQYFTLAATVTDAEDGACPTHICNYTWTPAPMFGATNDRLATYRFTTTGPRTFTVRVEDNGGRVTTRSITMQIVNTPPVAEIIRPSSAITVSTGVSVPLEGRGTDLNTGTIACGGCTPSISFAGIGTRTISVIATDPQGVASAPATVAITVNACTGTCGPTAFMTLPEPDWTYGGFPVFYRESTVALRLSIGHALAPAGSPVAYRLSARRIGTSTTTTIASGNATVLSAATPINVNVNWVVGTIVPIWSLCDTPSQYRNYELLLEATDSAGIRTTHAIEIKSGCALI